jgi:glutamate racemase
VNWFFSKGCHLVILACNTASAKALRTIQQNDLPHIDSTKRVLGVIRPTTEVVGSYTKSNCVGVLGTTGTVQSLSYPIEIAKFYPQVKVYQEACPMWVPLVENNEHNSDGADYFIQQHINNLLQQNTAIDTVLLACTHYPLLCEKIKKALPANVAIVSQGGIVANSLATYLNNHPEMEAKCSKNGSLSFYTTDSAEGFDTKATIFFGQKVISQHLDLSK